MGAPYYWVSGLLTAQNESFNYIPPLNPLSSTTIIKLGNVPWTHKILFWQNNNVRTVIVYDKELTEYPVKNITISNVKVLNI